LVASGLPDVRGQLAPHTHELGLLPLDRAGHVLRHNELDEWVATARDAANIGPGEAQVVRYRLEAPRTARWPLILQVRLQARRYTSDFQAFAFSQQPAGSRPPNPVRVLAEATLRIGPARAQWTVDGRWLMV